MPQEDYLISMFRKDDCKRLIRSKLNALPESATIREAIDALRSQWSSYVCILDGEHKLKGIITERDILRHIGSGTLDENASVKTIINTDYHTIECKESIAQIALTLYKNTFMHLPILDEGKLIGIVSARDFIHYLVEYFAESVHTLKPAQPTQDKREGA
ncbi:MAG: CBS domain-containing protein [Candidatus Hodarchaeales archaeon]|jgi:CBS domain-containing protein